MFCSRKKRYLCRVNVLNLFEDILEMVIKRYVCRVNVATKGFVFLRAPLFCWDDYRRVDVHIFIKIKKYEVWFYFSVVVVLCYSYDCSKLSFPYGWKSS